MRILDLMGAWTLSRADGSDSVPVRIPGSVVTGYMGAGLLEDPYWRLNEWETLPIFREDYVFTRIFDLPADILGEERVDLVADPETLDTLCTISINGRLIASTDNMHCGYRFPVKEALTAGANVLRIEIKSPIVYCEQKLREHNRDLHYVASGAIEGNEYLRKPHSMFGWDWGIQLPDSGIYRSLRLEAASGPAIGDVKIGQRHEDGLVTVDVLVRADYLEGRACRVKAELTPDPDTVSGPVYEETVYGFGEIPAGGESVCISLEVKEPRLWWPNGLGEQALYDLSVTLMDEEGAALDVSDKTIGLRTVTVRQEEDEWGREFTFVVNGVPVFMKGANYIPEDAVYPRITRETSWTLVADCARANYNILRVWGGGYYPSDDFYDACDRYGILVWQDFMFACNVYIGDEAFTKSIEKEAIDNVKRLRHHAALALWCGNNECEQGWVMWEGFGDGEPLAKDYYRLLFEEMFPRVVAEYDGSTFYWPSSPSSGGNFDDPMSEEKGDAHYWEVWHGLRPFSDFKKHFFRYQSEFGFEALPAMKTIKDFTEPADRNFYSPVMENHDKCFYGDAKIMWYMADHFRFPKDFENLVYVSEVLQAYGITLACEHLRRIRPRCMGTTYWQVNDNWPVTSWASIDYTGRWKALHYAAARFYAPIVTSIDVHDGRADLYVVNDTLEKKDFVASLKLRALDFTVVDEWHREGTVEGGSSVKPISMPTEAMKGKEPYVFLEATVVLSDGQVLRNVETLKAYRELELAEPTVSIEVEELMDRFRLVMAADTFTPYIYLDFDNADVLFSDNYFTISNPEPVVVDILKSDIRAGYLADAEDVAERLKVITLYDSYR